jgi:hypothetical protein
LVLPNFAEFAETTEERRKAPFGSTLRAEKPFLAWVSIVTVTTS